MRREHESELHEVEIITEVSGLGDAYVYVCVYGWKRGAGCQPGPRSVGVT
jgi:hypothetical protein